MIDFTSRRFRRLPIDKALMTDLTLESGEEFSLKLLQDPSPLTPGEYCNRYALRFSCLRDIRLSLELPELPVQLLSHSVRRGSRPKRNFLPLTSRARKMQERDTWWFMLRFAEGSLELEAEAFCATVIQRIVVGR